MNERERQVVSASLTDEDLTHLEALKAYYEWKTGIKLSNSMLLKIIIKNHHEEIEIEKLHKA